MRFARCAQSLEGGLQGLALGDRLHLVYLVLLDWAPFAIRCWSAWSAAFQGLPPAQRGTAEKLGITDRLVWGRTGAACSACCCTAICLPALLSQTS